VFAGYDYDKHTSCLSEAEMTMGKFFKPKDKKVKTEEVAGEKDNKKQISNGTPSNASEGKTVTNNGSLKTPTNEENKEELKSPIADAPMEWKGWKKTMKQILEQKDGKKMLLKNLKTQLKKVLESNNYEVKEDEFDTYFEKYSKSSIFEKVESKYIRYVLVEERGKTNWNWENKIIQHLEAQPDKKAKEKRVRKMVIEEYMKLNSKESEEKCEEYFNQSLEKLENIANDGKFLQLVE